MTAPTPEATSTAPTGDIAFPAPGDAFPPSDDLEDRWDQAGLEELAAFALAHSTRSLLVLERGRVVLERHIGDPATRSDVASVQKSICSLLVAIALERQLVTIDTLVDDVIAPGWSTSPDEAAITVGQLLTMTCGLDYAWTPVSPPGEAWHYTNAFNRLYVVLETLTGAPLPELARSWLFDPIGATGATYEVRGRMTDPNGDASRAAVLSAADLARIGVLVLAGGRWDGTPVVPAEPLEESLRSIGELNPAYGRLWWLNGKSAAVLPNDDRIAGPLIPSAPPDTVAALGAGDQKLYVSRSTGLVVVRLGRAAGEERATSSSFDEQLWQHIAAARRT